MKNTNITTRRNVIKQFEGNLIRKSLARFAAEMDGEPWQKMRNRARRDAGQRQEDGPANSPGFNSEMFPRSRFMLEMTNIPKAAGREAVIKRARLDIHRGIAKKSRLLIWTGITMLEAVGEDIEEMANEHLWDAPVFANYN